MFISIFAASCRPHQIISFLDNLAETAEDNQSFEVLIKLDEGDTLMVQLLNEYRKNAPFTLKYLVTPKLNGYYTLNKGYNELLKITDPNTYFCWLLTDEVRFETYGWDTLLKQYIRFFPDDIFRLKLSFLQLKNYVDFFECLPLPDNYAVTTRKWLEITDGWGNFWGPDSWHQCIDYYLGLCKNKYYPHGIWRSFPIFDIKLSGQEAGLGINDRKAEIARELSIFEGWRRYSTHAAQENFLRLAQRLNAHIYAYASQLGRYVIKEDLQKKTVMLFAKNGNAPETSWEYKLPRLSLKLFIGNKHANFWHIFPWLFYLRKKLSPSYKRLERYVTQIDSPYKTHYLSYKFSRRLISILSKIKNKLDGIR